MITILTSFKPFNGGDRSRQLAAIRSWMLVFPDCEILAFGSSGDVSTVASDFNIRCVKGVPLGEERLPRIDVMFSLAQQIGHYDLQLYINADIILGPDFVEALECMPQNNCLVVGRRWDWSRKSFGQILCKADLLECQRVAFGDGCLHNATGLDYFGYRRGTLLQIKPLYVGAVGWDNYMVGYALKRKMQVVDVSQAVIAVHQNHGYSYLAGGKEEIADGSIAKENKRLLRELSENHLFTVSDATHCLVGGHILPARTPEYVEQRMHRWRVKNLWLQNLRIPWRVKYCYCWANLYAGV